VLDTWFSSWLWPFSTLGWPERTKDLAYFYPTDALVTAPEIIFFWVARMIMAGLSCMKDIPFRRVYIHGTVRDLTGKKMSKSLGNIIDPLEIIEQFGADALRYTLVTSTAVGTDVLISEEKFVVGRNFANKLWNATRFLLSQGPVPVSVPHVQTITDRWILSRLQHTVEKVTNALEAMLFNEAASSIYDFLWHDVCDWYIEISKAVEASEKENSRSVLSHVLEVSMRLLHPFMPFVTEELWQQLKPAGSKPSIMVSAWPVPDKHLVDTKAEPQFERFKKVVTSIRITRADLHVPNDRKTPTVWLVSKDTVTRDFFSDHRTWLQALAQVSAVAVLEDFHRQKDAIVTVVDGVEVVIPLGGLIDVQKETKRLQQKINTLTGYVERTTARLQDKQFTEKAPADVIEQFRQQVTQAQETLKKYSDYLSIFQSM
jgi:valyl-tRNA synthetase